jgi:hypothetical protein
MSCNVTHVDSATLLRSCCSCGSQTCLPFLLPVVAPKHFQDIRTSHGAAGLGIRHSIHSRHQTSLQITPGLPARVFWMNSNSFQKEDTVSVSKLFAQFTQVGRCHWRSGNTQRVFSSINTQERLPYISYITYALEDAMLQAVGRSLLPNCEFCTYSGGSQGLELRIPSLNCSTIMSWDALIGAHLETLWGVLKDLENVFSCHGPWPSAIPR